MDQPSTSTEDNSETDADSNSGDALSTSIVPSEEEAEDVSDSSSESNDDNLPNNTNFLWRDCNEFRPDVYNFDNADAGVTDLFDVADDAEEYDYFVKFFDIELLQTIVDKTNRYFEFCTRGEDDASSYIKKRWINTTTDEMYSFLAL